MQSARVPASISLSLSFLSFYLSFSSASQNIQLQDDISNSEMRSFLKIHRPRSGCCYLIFLLSPPPRSIYIGRIRCRIKRRGKIDIVRETEHRRRRSFAKQRRKFGRPWIGSLFMRSVTQFCSVHQLIECYRSPSFSFLPPFFRSFFPSNTG